MASYSSNGYPMTVSSYTRIVDGVATFGAVTLAGMQTQFNGRVLQGGQNPFGVPNQGNGRDPKYKSINQWINQSVNQLTNQSINQRVNQPIDEWKPNIQGSLPSCRYLHITRRYRDLHAQRSSRDDVHVYADRQRSRHVRNGDHRQHADLLPGQVAAARR